MTEAFLAEGAIEVGHHETANCLGLTVNVDTVASPRSLQSSSSGWHFSSRQGHLHRCSGRRPVVLRGDHRPDAQPDRSAIGMRIAPFVLPLAVTLFVYILISNWLSVLPLQYSDQAESIQRAVLAAGRRTSTTCSRSLSSCSSATTWRASGAAASSDTRSRCSRGTVAVARVIFMPINVVEELAKPISLSLRLFGNIFAGGILVSLIALFPPYIMWAPNAIWKAFDLFVGAIQAFIFALLTILYFSQVDGAGRGTRVGPQDIAGSQLPRQTW